MQKKVFLWSNKKGEYDLHHKVRDHCHYTEKFRGAAHNIFNLRYKVPKEIPVVFHNGSTYDNHFIIIESSYPAYLDANNLYGWAMYQKLPINGFKWVEKLSRFNKRFIKNYNENSDGGYFLEVDVKYPKKLFNFYKDLLLLPERKKCEKLICSLEDQKNMLFT